MYRVVLTSRNDLERWRDSVRPLLVAGIRPEAVVWTLEGEEEGASLFAAPQPPPGEGGTAWVSRSFLTQAELALCHADPRRFDLLFRLAFRLQSERRLLEVATDRDVAALGRLGQAVRRDSHKMKAFVRFRALDDSGSRFAAWFEPEHFTLERTAPFFVERFSGMEWAILTPYRSAVWDGQALAFGPGAGREDVPPEDALDAAWRTYFSAVFNPARLKIGAMTSEMPRKYWRNLPEAECIPALIRSAQQREVDMIARGASQPPSRHARQAARDAGDLNESEETFSSLAMARKAVQECTRCPLYANATQAVFGEGPAEATTMVVGEQPGDSEDLEGRPFVGPAGKLFDVVLGEVGIDRKTLYVTNAVKHFKFLPRGKKRLHQKPNGGEVRACRFWLDHERALVKPKVIVALGATAAQSLLGSGATISKLRGAPIALEDGTTLFVTVHPSYLLRIPERERARSEREAFARDLAMIRDHIESKIGTSAA